MILANELRIGNAIWDQRRQKVKWVNHRVINDLASYNNPIAYDPIPLTEEWLLKFGFKKHFASYTLSNFWPDIKFYSGNVFEVVYNDDFEIKQEIQYVHQLQNLYFALTGQELEMKEK